MHPTMKQAQDISGWLIQGSGGGYSPRRAAEDILPPTEVDVRGNQFMYLFRRFGFPIHGSDGHKDIASYYLTTPDKDVVLWCKPDASWFGSFGYGLSPALGAELEQTRSIWYQTRSRPWKSHPLHFQIDLAIRAAITELLRPVFIRDVDYNITGRPPIPGLPEMEPAASSHQAGFGLGEFDPTTEFSE